MTDLIQRPVGETSSPAIAADEAPRTELRTLPVGIAAVTAVRAPREWPVVTSRVLIALVLVAGWVIAYVCVLSGFQAAHAQRGLYNSLRTQLALGSAPIGGAIATGAPVAVLDIPSLGTGRLVVVEGTSAEQLQQGPGHQRLSVLPGQPGWSVVYGRAVSFGGVFADIESLTAGTRMVVTTGQGRFVYRVADVRHSGDVVTAPASGRARLSLVTATGSGPLAALSAARPVVVDADLVGRPATSHPPTGAVRSSVTDSENPMAVDTSLATVLELVLTLQLVIAAALLSVWAWNRWSRTSAWIVGLPLVLAALWFCSGIATRLLPNLL